MSKRINNNSNGEDDFELTQQSEDFSPFLTEDEWVDHWFYTVGINVLPQPTKSRDPNKFMIWQVWQNKPVPEVLFEQWKKEGKFRDSEGICLIPGRVWRGKYEGSYLAFIDLDNEKAITEFCTTPNRGLASLEELSKRFIVEQHSDDPGKLTSTCIVMCRLSQKSVE